MVQMCHDGAVPKLIDKVARERAIGEAAWQVVVHDGVTRLSVRNVAARAGIATGSLRYVFPTQDSLRAFVLDLVRQRVAERIATRRPSASPRQLAEDYLAQLLPLDAERRVEMEVFLSVGVLALTDPALRPAFERAHRDLRDGCRRILARLAEDPAYATLDPQAEAPRTHAVVDGLALHLIRLPPDDDTTWATRTLARHLDTLRG